MGLKYFMEFGIGSDCKVSDEREINKCNKKNLKYFIFELGTKPKFMFMKIKPNSVYRQMRGCPPI